MSELLCYAQLAESLGQDGDGHRVGGGRGFSGLVLVGTTNVVGRCESRTVLTGTGAAGIQRGGRERYSKVGCDLRIHYNTSFYHYNTSLKSIQKLVNTSQIHVNVPLKYM